MRGGSDEADSAALKMREKDVLLGFVEAVNLVDEENRGLIAELGVGLGGFDLGADFGDVGFDPIERFEAGAGGASDDGGEGGFSGAGWAVKDEGSEAVGLDGAAEKFSFGEDVLLAGDFGKRAGSHAGGQGFVPAALQGGIRGRFFGSEE